jgi:hypothetical protein
MGRTVCNKAVTATLGMPKNTVEPKYSDEEMKIRDQFVLEILKISNRYIDLNVITNRGLATWCYAKANELMIARKEGLND